MDRPLSSGYKRNLVFLSIILTIVFLIINISFYIINSNYLNQKVQEENVAFSLIVTHLLNENDVSVAIEYIEHYTHIHEIEVEFVDEDNVMLYSSNINHQYTKDFELNTDKGMFTLLIDNTDSTTVVLVEKNILYLNISLVITYIISFIALSISSKKYKNSLEKDLEKIIAFIDLETIDKSLFNYSEFKKIYNVLYDFLQNIDLLKEQKEINIKGLAHDIKTPLTIIYSFINTLQKGNTVTVKQSNTAFLAANNINDLLGVLLEENYQSNVKVINLSTILEGKIQEYSDVFKSKTMTLNLENTEDVFTEWNSRDFKRILDNLISNAFYYSKINSSVQIKLSKHEKVELIIESEPINKNEIDLDNMFEKGFRGHESSKSNQSGKGLGLYLCKILLLPVNGKIDAHIVDNKIIMTVIL